MARELVLSSGARLNPSAAAGVRGMIIERFATTEALIDAVICSYYFPGTKPPREFLEDVLYDESFSFAFRRNIFEKILRHEGLFDDKRMQEIRRFAKLRNAVAHKRGELDELKMGEEALQLANRVEKYFVGVVAKLRLRFHADPLPLRGELLEGKGRR